MAFKIQDLMVDVVPGGEAIRRADTIIQCQNCNSQTQPCPHPSCKGKSHHPPPKPKEVHTVPAGLFLLRQQLRQTLSQGR
jgi:hypothetical protein